MEIPYDENDNRVSRHREDEQPMHTAPPSTYQVSVYGGFWLRLWAYLLDLIVVGSVNGLLISPIFILSDANPEFLTIFTVHGILTSIMAYVYFLLMTKFFGQTLGKMAFGLRVVSVGLTKPTWGEVFTREVPGRMIHRVLVITNIMYVVVGFHPQKAGVHDLLADTRVVRDVEPIREDDQEDDEDRVEA
ncbi:RDD family protein [Geomicrobium sp. JCM 19039]|uniref:RDD family protein n=1 Tax=Geomicrobium sp. JCM 19039 TaxID=1460636 RepID=UPI00045F47A7|nr:RDD family protein [Geomicrobium sp. JCM 19039]GAK12937.1 hypothetical protein JCM19039_2744 [Geomicrobium sp. JCM 19039]